MLFVLGSAAECQRLLDSVGQAGHLVAVTAARSIVRRRLCSGASAAVQDR